MNLKNIVLEALVNGLVILILCIATSMVNVYIFENCDAKLGCTGVVWFSAFIGGIAGVTSIAAYITLFLFKNKQTTSFKIAIASGVVLTPVVFTIMDWSVGLILMVLGWFCLSLVVVYLCTTIIGVKREFT